MGNKTRYLEVTGDPLNVAGETIEVEGVIKAVMKGTTFRVELSNGSGHEVLAHISGKMRKHFIRLNIGDKVKMDMSPYDLSKARITYRVRDDAYVAPKAAGPRGPRRR